jgi:tRNA modification GTPase
MREGMKTVIIGRPNVGKSSLLNRLLREERAIVSEFPGTTRDLIEEQLLLDGIPLVLTDTAGIRATEDHVEKIGVAKTKETLKDAELAVVVLDGAQTLQEEDREILLSVKEKPYVYNSQ